MLYLEALLVLSSERSPLSALAGLHNADAEVRSRLASNVDLSHQRLQAILLIGCEQAITYSVHVGNLDQSDPSDTYDSKDLKHAR